MYRSSAKRLSAFFVSAVAVFFLGSTSALFGANTTEKKTIAKINPAPLVSVRTGISQPLRSMNLPRPKPGATRREFPMGRGPNAGTVPTHKVHDTAIQQRPAGGGMPGPLVSFEGVDDSICFCQPADPNAAVGPNNVAQYVNVAFQIWDKDGNDQTGGAVVGNAFWQGFGGPCQDSNSGDPIVLYDQLADRWIFSQFALTSSNHQCFAVSTSGDPLDTYYLYDFLYSNTDTNDYPKISVWPDAYYMTVRNFGATFTMTVTAFDRAAMLTGAEATGVRVDLNNPNFDGLLPANLDGSTPPPGYGPHPQGGQPIPSLVLAGMGHPDADGSPTPRIHLYYFRPDFTTPENSVFTGPVDIDVDPYNFVPQFSETPQPPPGGGLEANGWIQYRLPYRNFGDHQSLVIEHDVFDDGGRVVPRWYEVRDPFGAPTVYQQGTYAPDDGIARWMGSAAMDANNNIAIGYSVADASTVNPGIRWAGRLANDPPGDLTLGEAELIPGDEPFGGFRWGDYSSLAIDPVDQCTFWYTTMYTPASEGGDWSTRIGSFKFPTCSLGPSGTLEGTVTDGTNPLAGVKVTAGAGSTLTDASGHYEFTMPVGTYDMTAVKYGFLPGSANGIEVTEDGDTVQDFELAVAPSVTVNGVVKDGSGGGWPLYAKVVIKAPGAPTFTMYTDPVTGYYSQTLVSGIPYNFTITAVSSGYLPGGGSVPLGSVPMTPTATVVNWSLEADLVSCNAPGYAYPPGTLFEGFSTGALPAGWSTATPNAGGNWRFPASSSGDGCANSGPNNTGGSGGFAILDSDCDGLVQDDAYLNTPSVDLSGVPSPTLQFNSDYIDLDSVADVDLSTDGGSTWSNVWERAGADDPGPSTQSIDISGAAGGQADVRARFHFTGFWAWWWSIDNVLMGDPEISCASLSGGLVVGNVLNANNGDGLSGATVENLTDGGSTTTFKTPDDPNQPDGLYILFAESGSTDLKASLAQYGNDQHTVTVIPNSVIRRDFTLQSGNVSVTPSRLDARVDPAGTDEQDLTVKNTGGASASFEMVEINAPLLTSKTHGFASDALRKQALARFSKDSSSRADLARSTKGLAPLPNPRPAGRPMANGDVVAFYPTGITFGWGVASSGSNFWLSNIGVGGGDDKDYQYDSASGAQTGNVMSDSGIGQWAGDGAFNTQTGMIWRVAVGGDNCIHELDPVSLTQTGNTICGSPWTATSQRGMAYDAVNNAYFVGGWNEGIVYHIDSDGVVIDSANVGLSISGMAYDSSNGHLLVMSNTDGTDITVLDALNNYATVGSYNVMDGASRAFGPFEQAGIEFDCIGNLWAVNQITQVVYNVSTGENAGCAVDIPWLSLDPTEGTVSSGGGTATVGVTFSALQYLPGLKQAQLQVKTDTPAQVPGVPVSMTVRFLDVPDDNQFQAYIYGISGAGVMFGGSPVCSDVFHFCPNGVVTRADMAGYLFRALHGPNTPPPVYQNTFGDVSFNDYNAFYIQGIYDDGITAGCSASPLLYCPNIPVTRAQMSVFVWKDQHGSEAPPACTGVFADVPCPDGFAVDYIEGLYNEGITAGCGGGNFCPHGPITNGQMAVFLVKAFNIPYLP